MLPTSSYAHHLRGVFLIATAVFIFSVMDAIVKYLSSYYPSPNLAWARFTVHMIFVCLILVPRLKMKLFKTQRLSLQLFRSVLMFGTTFLFFSGLKYFGLAEATTILFISPILLIAISPILLGEKPGIKEWGMVLIGFAGMLMMLRPSSEMLKLEILFPIGAACCFTLFQIITRKLNGENPFTTLFYTGLIGTLATSVIVSFNWVTPAPAHILLLILLGALGGMGHFMLIKAFFYAPAPMLAPFIYTQMIWATILGFIFFETFPDGWSFLGMIVIGITGWISSMQGNFSFIENNRRKGPEQRVALDRRQKIFKWQRRI